MPTKPTKQKQPKELMVKSIRRNPDQPRKHFDEAKLEDLAESIKEHGIIQPLVVKDEGGGKYLLVAGERRFRAAEMLGLDKVPVVITAGDPLEIALIENLQRENLSPIEEAEALQRMADEHGYTQERLSSIAGKARSTIAEILKLTKLPESIKEECRESTDIPRNILIEIAKRDSEEEMLRLFEQVKKHGLKIGDVRKITRNNPGWREKPKIIDSKVKTLEKSLASLDLDKIGDEDQEKLILRLLNLKTSIDKVWLEYEKKKKEKSN